LIAFLACTPAVAETWLAAVEEEAEEAATTATAPAEQPGEPATWPPGLLMESLGAVGARKPLDDIGLRIWGFVETGFTGRLTGGQDPLPLRVFDARRPNNLRLNQFRLTVDRPYDSAKPFDIGARVDGLFGGDALLTHSPGLFYNAGHGNGDAWADMVQAYGQTWFKTGDASGLEITVGKFVTPIGAEVIDATGNALYSHSFLFGYAIPFTHTGVNVKYVFNDQASAYFAIVKGWEVFNDNNNAHSYIAGGSLSGSEQIDGHARTILFANVITGPEQDHDVNNNRTVIDGTLTHWWTENLSQSINADYGMEENVPDVGYAKWYGAAHYLTYIFSEKVSGTWRAELFRDQGGSRTGYDTAFYENTWGLGITPCPENPTFSNLMFRPEFRWDYSCDDEVFGGGRRSQLTLAMDVVFKF